MSCIFCKIIAKEIPATIIEETDDILVIKDINPKAPIHYLLIPKKHLVNLLEFDNDAVQLAGNLLLMAKKIALGMSDSSDFRLIMNNGAQAGQIVFHAHIHFLAHKKMADF